MNIQINANDLPIGLSEKKESCLINNKNKNIWLAPQLSCLELDASDVESNGGNGNDFLGQAS